MVLSLARCPSPHLFQRLLPVFSVENVCRWNGCCWQFNRRYPPLLGFKFFVSDQIVVREFVVCFAEWGEGIVVFALAVAVGVVEDLVW